MTHRPLLLTLLAAAALTAAAGTQAAAAVGDPGARTAPTEQRLAILDHDTAAFAAPNPASGRVTELNDARPITGERTVLPVIGQATSTHGLHWLEVLLPGRPDSHSGWIRRRATTEAFTQWRIVVSLSTETITVLYGGRTAASFRAVVGKPSTPTPTGRFFVEENVKMGPTLPGAPYALALSARSNVLQEYDGGPGQIAIHGTSNLVGVPGTAASHGCIRLSTPDITWLASRIGPGVPVTIEP